MDSGAYSAFTSDKHIALGDYISCIKRLQDTAHAPRHVFALDVIGDEYVSYSNAIAMRTAGIEVIPTWHAGSSLEALRRIADEFSRIAIGGLVGRRPNRRLVMGKKARIYWVSKAFETVWPKWIHGFGLSFVDLLQSFPFASVDSLGWRFTPEAFGIWKTFGGKLPLRKVSSVGVDCEIKWYLEFQEKLKQQWKREHESVQESNFSIKFACCNKKEIVQLDI